MNTKTTSTKKAAENKSESEEKKAIKLRERFIVFESMSKAKRKGMLLQIETVIFYATCEVKEKIFKVNVEVISCKTKKTANEVYDEYAGYRKRGIRIKKDGTLNDIKSLILEMNVLAYNFEGKNAGGKTAEAIKRRIDEIVSKVSLS